MEVEEGAAAVAGEVVEARALEIAITGRVAAVGVVAAAEGVVAEEEEEAVGLVTKVSQLCEQNHFRAVGYGLIVL